MSDFIYFDGRNLSFGEKVSIAKDWVRFKRSFNFEAERDKNFKWHPQTDFDFLIELKDLFLDVFNAIGTEKTKKLIPIISGCNPYIAKYQCRRIHFSEELEGLPENDPTLKIIDIDEDTIEFQYDFIKELCERPKRKKEEVDAHFYLTVECFDDLEDNYWHSVIFDDNSVNTSVVENFMRWRVASERNKKIKMILNEKN